MSVRKDRPTGEKSNQRGPQLGARLHKAKLGRAGGERVFRLDRCDMGYLGGATQRTGRNLGKPDGFRFALGDKTGQNLGHLFDRTFGLATVDVEQIDGVDAKPFQAAVQLAFQMLDRVVKDADAIAPRDGRLRGNRRLVPRAGIGGEPGADDLFRAAHSIDVRRIDMGDASVQTGIENGVAGRLGRVAVDARERHGTNTKLRDFRAVPSKPCGFHKAAP